VSRILAAATTFVLLSAAKSRAETFSGQGMVEIMESLGTRLFAGGIVLGLVVFAAFRLCRAIKDRRRS